MRWKRRPEGSNWGEFGADDQIGRMNLLTPARRLAGVREVTEGLAFTLSLPLDYPGSSNGLRKPPRLFAAELDGHAAFNQLVEIGGHVGCDALCDDGVVLYTQYSTQWDSLAHWGRLFDADDDGVAEIVYYNGYRADAEIVAPANGEGGAGALGIERLATAGVQGRGVLVSLKAAYGDARRLIGYDDLMRAVEAQRVELRTGDFLLLHTGYDEALLSMRRQPDEERLDRTGAALDGGDARLLRWIDDSGLVAICSDNQAIEGFDAFFSDGPAGPESLLPLHELCLFKLGIHLGELWQLNELADWLLAHDRHAFLLTAPPLRLPGAVGSPATPIATV